MATGAISEQPELLFFDAVLHVSPGAVALLVYGLGALAQAGVGRKEDRAGTNHGFLT